MNVIIRDLVDYVLFSVSQIVSVCVSWFFAVAVFVGGGLSLRWFFAAAVFVGGGLSLSWFFTLRLWSQNP